jgi:protein-disulfide isomerase
MPTRRAILATTLLTLVTNAFAQGVSVMELHKAGALPDKILGDEKAPVTIVEYASSTCHHCGTFHTQTYPTLKAKYIDTGKARLIFREFPLNSLSAASFMLARCMPEKQYFPFVEILFKTQEDWSHAPDKAAALLNLAQQAGMTKDGFEACLKDQKLLDGVQNSQDRGSKFGVEATPTFFINGKKYSGAMSIAEFDKILEPLLK